MKVVLYGATGRLGRPILDELVNRGHQVTAVARHPQSLPNTVRQIADDLSQMKSIVETISGADAVISAYAPPKDDTDQLVKVTERFIMAVEQAHVARFIMVGGCGSLEYSPGVTVLDSGHWPAQYVPVAISHMRALAMLRASTINWTYFSPPISITAGQRTGKFRLGGDRLLRDAQGNSSISFEDYAVALVDELEKPSYERARFTIGCWI